MLHARFVSKSDEKCHFLRFGEFRQYTHVHVRSTDTPVHYAHKHTHTQTSRRKFPQIAPLVTWSELVRSLPPTSFQEHSQLRASPSFKAELPLRLPVLAVALFLVNGKGFPAWLVRAHFCMVSQRSPDWQGFSMVGNGCGWLWVCGLLRALSLCVLSGKISRTPCRLRPISDWSEDGALAIPASLLGYLSVVSCAPRFPVEYLNSHIPSSMPVPLLGS